ncbi:hypothetical protein [Paenibacillus sp. YN15]|uniref:hypothetical protein n=1 Tax=Paenibacillus sp. YN15 TaxID=1742774 RepID=UPI000DCE2911|nr:hypothetical protein [Paenibacillus sp. YN15]RAU99817.1 hypothetical protein DQG13_15040 [Paenibacillus sp. YN15]
MKPERLIYTFVSFASYLDKVWGKGTPVAGVERTAAVAHKHGIPVTWIVNSGSIAELGNQIRDWHDQFGDSVILNCPSFICDYDKGEMKHSLKRELEREWNILSHEFPWVQTKVVASGYVNNEMVQVLEDLGFDGVWGYCWEQVWWDGISHRGCPWGMWYIDSSRYKAPHREGGTVVACEWTSRDLHAAYHSGNPCLFSTDPNDVLRAGLCSGKDIRYWEHLFQQYLVNTESNDAVFFIQHQEAHEMEVSYNYSVYPLTDVEQSEEMLDRFFGCVRKFDVVRTNLPDAIRTYKTINPRTAPNSMLTGDSGIHPEMNAYTLMQGGTPFGPWPKTFFYYDSECQMVFTEGRTQPALLRNYVGKARMDEDFTESIPMVVLENYVKSDSQIDLEFNVGMTAPKPFGIAYWDELGGFEVAGIEPGIEYRLIQNKILFLRFSLEGQPKRIRVRLRKQNATQEAANKT